jgi:hypothetical protein
LNLRVWNRSHCFKHHLANIKTTLDISTFNITMPLFTKFKKAKDAAVEHKKTVAAEQVKEPAPPYRHVPTHAKQDALATQPTTVRPEELQARIAAARKRRAVSWQSTVPSRHSVYHSCESSPASSRANSIANFPSGSTRPSLSGTGSSAESIDTIMRRPHSASNKQGFPMADGRIQPYDLSSPALGRPLGFPLPPPHRPRNVKPKSRRSSFTKKKSPLSSVSVEEGTSCLPVQVIQELMQWLETDEISSSGSDTSAVSTRKHSLVDVQRYLANIRLESSTTNDSLHSDSQGKTLGDVTPIELPIYGPQPPSNAPLVRTRSRWPLFQRKSIDITAH